MTLKWSKDLIFLQRRCAEGQQAHEKIPNITNHQGNANQNRNENHITLVMMLLSKNKNKQNKCWQRCGGIGNLYTTGGNVK